MGVIAGRSWKEDVMNLPDVVSLAEWEAANERIIASEKALMKEGDALAAGSP
jgi:predicted dithiol-disulfide oxidoreductase (DUF899 family)